MSSGTYGSESAERGDLLKREDTSLTEMDSLGGSLPAQNSASTAPVPDHLDPAQCPPVSSGTLTRRREGDGLIAEQVVLSSFPSQILEWELFRGLEGFGQSSVEGSSHSGALSWFVVETDLHAGTAERGGVGRRLVSAFRGIQATDICLIQLEDGVSDQLQRLPVNLKEGLNGRLFSSIPPQRRCPWSVVL